MIRVDNSQVRVMDMSEGIIDPLDEQVCAIVGRSLVDHYPGHAWLVECDRNKGVIDIRNTSLSGQMGCRIPMKGYATASELALLAMRYGGELLERYQMARGRLDDERRDELPTNFAGDILFDGA